MPFVSPARAYGLLALLCLLLFVPGIADLPPIDRDEARFAQATWQMLESHDYVRIRFQEEPRNKKPIGIYWLQAVSVKLLGSPGKKEIRPFRIPSVLGAVVAVLFTYSIGRKLFGDEAALLGAGLFACTPLLIVEAHQATTDAVLLACMTASQWALAHLYTEEASTARSPWKAFLVFWMAQGVGILVKGPMVPLVAMLTIVTVSRSQKSWKWLKPLRPWLGLLLAAIIILPWTIAIWKATEGAFFRDAVTGDLLPKLVSGHESHGALPGYYLLFLPLAFWPASCLLGMTLRDAWMQRTVRGTRFCICWILPAWLLLEAVPTKLPHYVLPLYPALALLSAHTMVTAAAGTGITWPRFWPPAVSYGLLGLVALLMSGGIMTLSWASGGYPGVFALVSTAAAMSSAILAVVKIKRSRILQGMLVCMAASPLIFGPILQALLPDASMLWLSPALEARISRLASTEGLSDVKVVSAGYHEPSLVFLMGTDTRLTTPQGAAEALKSSNSTIAIIWEREEPAFLDRSKELSSDVRLLDTITGFNYSKGRRMTLKLYTNAGGCLGSLPP